MTGEPGKKEREEREHLDSFTFLQCMEFKNRAQEAVSRIFSRIIRLMTTTTRCSVQHCTPHADGAWLNELGWSQ